MREAKFMGWRDYLLRAVMALCRVIYWWPLRRATRDPDTRQWRVLRNILAANAATDFGQRYEFAEVHTLEDFRCKVPVQTFETLRPYIQRQALTGRRTLTTRSAVMYALTSGTTGKPKYLPLSLRASRQTQAEQRLFSCLQYAMCPEAFAGKILAIVSPRVERRMVDGVPAGAVSGFLYETTPKIIKTNYVLPCEVFEIDDYDLKYKTVLRLALAEVDITYMGAANPSSFLRLQEVLNESWEELAESLETGCIPELARVEPGIRHAIEARLEPNPRRAAELRRLAHRGGVTFAELWPRLRLLTTWTGGSCGIALDSLTRALPPTTRVMDLGYISSEFRGTIPVGRVSNGGLPLLHHHFFEFVEKNRWENGTREFLTLGELKKGCEYFVLVTTSSGLYRYFMNDVVKVVDFYEATPLIVFLQKGKGVTNITGEKICESQVLDAVKNSENNLGFDSPFFVMLADEVAAKYELFLELDPTSESLTKIAEEVDDALCVLNIEYRGKRASGRLRRLDVFALSPGTADAYKRFYLGHGQREGQFKPVILQYKKDCGFRFRQHAPGYFGGGLVHH
jgi:hypothetical protein